MITAIRQDLRKLIDIHTAIGGAWSIETRRGAGFAPEIIIAATTAEDERRLAEMLDIALSRVLSVNGENWWSEGVAMIDGIRVRITGPHYAVVGVEEPTS